MNYKNLSELEKNQLVKQYENLIVKITNQFFQKVNYPWEDIQSYAYEGFALAIQKYDETRSSMSFTQYAAYYMRNNILNALNTEIRTVKMDTYAQKIMGEKGVSSYNTISIDNNSEESVNTHDVIMSISVDDKFSNGNVFEYLYSRLEDEFSYRDCEIFYKAFGLKDFDVTKGFEIAKQYNVSAGLVSQCLKKMIEWIRKDTELCEQLSELLKV